MTRTIIAILTILWGSVTAVTAQFSEEYTRFKMQFPDADKIRLVNETNVYIGLNGDEITIDVDYIEEDLFLKPKAHFYSEDAISYSTFFEVSKVSASSFVFDGKKYNELKVKEYKHKDELSGDVFFDDNRTINFVYPKLEEGGKTRLTYSEKINNPRFLSPHYFGDFYPVIQSVYTITVDKRVSLDFKDFNTHGLDIEFSKTEKGKTNIYRWEAKNIDRYRSESNATHYRNSIAHLIPIITGYHVDNEQKYLLNDVEGLYNWYYQLVKDVNTEAPDSNLVSLVHQLTENKDSDLEKVRALYYWVQQNIKYVAFEYALGGFVPRGANDVFVKKFGDCKDNSSLLSEMLEIAGIDGRLTWVGTRDIPYSYREVPAPVSDNHMILTYIDGDDYYFLDATGRFLPLEMPSYFIQGKEALIAIDSSQFIIYEIPVIPAMKNYVFDTVHLEIEDNHLKGSGTTEMEGYIKLQYFDLLERQKTKEDINDLYNFNFRKGSNKCVISDIVESNKFEYDKAFIVDYSVLVRDYVSTTEDEIFINLNLDQKVSDYKTKKEDKLDKEYDYKDHIASTYLLRIPEGYSVDYLPPNIELNHDKYSAKINYRQEGDTIVYHQSITMDFLVLKSEELGDFNNFISKLEKGFKESIVLKKETP